uniref:PID domain-containing protein n=1 Tax=Mola mola TaxID=94237 RepID=A0A3Q3WIS3_MOLML
MGEAPGRNDGTVTRSAEYVGSFSVDDRCLDDHMRQLHAQLQALQTCRRGRPVSIRFSVRGVKMYDEDETTLLMAHALRRVSLCTARPVDAQFAFVAHNPGSVDAQLYCHVFRARHARAAQFLNLLLCRCFQLSYLDRHPEEAQEDSSGSAPRRSPSLLNHGFPLSVSALVSFRRAPFRGLFPGTKLSSQKHTLLPSSSSSPSLVRKTAIRTKELRSGAYRSFTFTPLKQRSVQDRLSASQGGPSVHRALTRVRELIRKGSRRAGGGEVLRAEPGRNRRSTGSGRVVLGWRRNVSVPSYIEHGVSSRCLQSEPLILCVCVPVTAAVPCWQTTSWDPSSSVHIPKNPNVAPSSFASPPA